MSQGRLGSTSARADLTQPGASLIRLYLVLGLLDSIQPGPEPARFDLTRGYANSSLPRFRRTQLDLGSIRARVNLAQLGLV